MATKQLSKQKTDKFDTILVDGLKTADWNNKEEFVELKAYALRKAIKLNHRYVRD